jgi:SAM-dependent methyltransferase
MLIVSGASREENRRDLACQLCQPRIPVRLVIQKSRLSLESVLWREYWQPCRAFLEADLRLVQRLNRLKRAWLNVLQQPGDRLSQMTYCWRYFGLLHHALRIAKDESSRPAPLSAIRRIIGFEAFLLDAVGEAGFAACAVTSRNPVFLLGQLAVDPTMPTPRHVPLLMPAGQNDAFYHYRQVQISGTPAQRMLVHPAVDLRHRASSFTPIDRLTRLVSERADPYWKPRARLLARRLLLPLLEARGESPASRSEQLCILDLGAGTGQLVAKAWTYLGRMAASTLPAESFHFVDSSPPAFGRSFGLARDRAGVSHVEWTTADYRTLADDDQWLQKCGPFDWVFACRIFDNASNFMIGQIKDGGIDHDEVSFDALPHRCLAPHSQPGGIRHLEVSTVRKRVCGGTAYPQFSLRDYFGAILSIQSGVFDRLCDNAWYLPVRRFNPAALITPSGRSLIAQLLKVSRALIIEDVDVEPEHLRQHKAQFGLPGTAAVFCTRDGFSTEANYHVVTSPEWVKHVQGERLW